VVEGRSGQVVTDWLDERGPDWCAGVTTAALDPFRGYERALRAALPGATAVLDSFHAVRLAQQAIDDVRRRVQQDTLGHRGRTGDPLYGIRRVLQRGAEHLSPKAYGRLLAGLDAGDPRGEVAAAYIACQKLRHLYAAPDTDRARRRLHTFYQACAAPGVPELKRLGRTISAWEDQLLAYFSTRWGVQWPDRGGELARQADQARRVRVPQLRQLPAPLAAALRRQLAHFPEAGHHVLWRRAGLPRRHDLGTGRADSGGQGHRRPTQPEHDLRG
jgi:transposase